VCNRDKKCLALNLKVSEANWQGHRRAA
jgi:hypothetical protein